MSVNEIVALKEKIRAEVRRRLGSLTKEARGLVSVAVAAQVNALPEWRAARSILFFYARPDEPDLLPLMEQSLAEDKIVLLPRYVPARGEYEPARIERVDADVLEGKFSIKEPAPACPSYAADKIDFVLVPGLAFSLSGARLGRGRAYYDRILTRAAGVRCGVGFEFQLYESLPVEAHDVAVQIVVCGNRVLRS